MLSDETKRKISESCKGRIPWNKNKPHSVETRDKISALARARFQNQESHPFYGRHHSEETKDKIRKSKLGQPGTFIGRHHNEETKAKIRQARLGKPSWNKGRSKSEETKIKLREAVKGRHHTEEAKAKMRGLPAWNKGKQHSAETREKIANKAQERMQSPEARRKISESHKGKSISIETKGKISATIKRLWKDPNFAQKVIRGRKEQWQRLGYRERVTKAIAEAMNKSPNKPEKHLIRILKREGLPFKYTGDGSFLLCGYIPDFVQCNGKKQIIEVFGDYWHNNEKISWHETELGRIMAYNQFGYETLVIWEHELEDEEWVVQKLKVFAGKV